MVALQMEGGRAAQVYPPTAGVLCAAAFWLVVPDAKASARLASCRHVNHQLRLRPILHRWPRATLAELSENFLRPHPQHLSNLVVSVSFAGSFVGPGWRCCPISIVSWWINKPPATIVKPRPPEGCVASRAELLGCSLDAVKFPGAEERYSSSSRR